MDAASGAPAVAKGYNHRRPLESDTAGFARRFSSGRERLAFRAFRAFGRTVADYRGKREAGLDRATLSASYDPRLGASQLFRISLANEASLAPCVEFMLFVRRGRVVACVREARSLEKRGMNPDLVERRVGVSGRGAGSGGLGSANVRREDVTTIISELHAPHMEGRDASIGGS